MKTGVLIVNIGTPESSSTQDVGIYLKKFLMDEDVIAIPFLFRWILVNLLIVPFRAVRSAAKYAKIWTPEGSPLKVNTEKFVHALTQELPSDYSVKIGMSFSEPSILTSLAQFKDENIDQIVVCPMFPQYAEATTGSVIKAVRKFTDNLKLSAQIKFIKPFYNQDFYLNNVLKKMKNFKPQHWIFSYHGLPEKQITKNSKCQLSEVCCLSQSECTFKCYRSHCVQTTEALAKKLNLNKSQYTMTFQSRLGVKQWLQPYTDYILKSLPTEGIKDISVVSPAFVAD
ncbi:MAG: ferrochelatase, partial [Bdellovibrionaceae bacterium]|nr:ferrochelatase [Pseudobdellovibrionaceae bacterium]